MPLVHRRGHDQSCRHARTDFELLVPAQAPAQIAITCCARNVVIIFNRHTDNADSQTPSSAEPGRRRKRFSPHLTRRGFPFPAITSRFFLRDAHSRSAPLGMDLASISLSSQRMPPRSNSACSTKAASAKRIASNCPNTPTRSGTATYPPPGLARSMPIVCMGHTSRTPDTVSIRTNF
jgi:hypothetical protein